MLKPPHPDPMLEPLRGGVAELLRDREVAGHVATQVTTFWAPFTFSLRRRWWVWYVVVWSDGQRERPEEDYPPWNVVRDMAAGRFVWDENDSHRGEYSVEWLDDEDRQPTLDRLGIRPDDF